MTEEHARSQNNYIALLEEQIKNLVGQLAVEKLRGGPVKGHPILIEKLIAERAIAQHKMLAPCSTCEQPRDFTFLKCQHRFCTRCSTITTFNRSHVMCPLCKASQYMDYSKNDEATIKFEGGQWCAMPNDTEAGQESHRGATFEESDSDSDSATIVNDEIVNE